MADLSGTDRAKLLLLPEAVDDYLGPDKPVRVIEAFVDGLDLQSVGFVRVAAKETVRPGFDPADLLKRYVYGYIHRERSSWRLDAEAHRNIELIWLLQHLRPDSRTIADFRRGNWAAFRHVFREFVILCRQPGVIGICVADLSPLRSGREPSLTVLLPTFFDIGALTSSPSLTSLEQMLNFAAYVGLFSTAFIAATIFPLQSEAMLVGMLVSTKFSVVSLIVVASVGNTLGAVANWFLGRWIERFRGYRWFPLSDEGLERSIRWYRRYGKWSLLLSWMPIIGDGLTVIAGVLREPLLTFTILVLIAKTGRYIAITLATLQLIG